MKKTKNFGGYWIKNLKNFKGHEGEHLLQCSVYKDNKRIGFYSDDSWGGPPQLQEFNVKEEKELIAFAKTIDKNPWAESYGSMIHEIAEIINHNKWLKRQCHKHCVFTTPDIKEGSYKILKIKYSGNEQRIKGFLDKEFPEYTIINKQI